jgi:hypothetical protein
MRERVLLFCLLGLVLSTHPVKAAEAIIDASLI